MGAINQLDLAYTAGLIDGEGHIKLRCSRKNSQSETFKWDTTLEVEMTDKPVIDWLYETYGGKTYNYSRLGRNQTWRWIIAGKSAYEVAKLIQPYIKGKQNQIDLFIKAYEECSTTVRIGKRIAEEVWERRHHYAQEIQTLRATP